MWLRTQRYTKNVAATEIENKNIVGRFVVRISPAACNRPPKIVATVDVLYIAITFQLMFIRLQVWSIENHSTTIHDLIKKIIIQIVATSPPVTIIDQYKPSVNSCELIY